MGSDGFPRKRSGPKNKRDLFFNIYFSVIFILKEKTYIIKIKTFLSLLSKTSFFLPKENKD